MDERLREAAQAGDTNRLYELVRHDSNILERIDEMAFCDNPLHVAASAGRVRFALEMMRLKPSFATKLNHGGLSPLHLALQHQKSNLVKRLVREHSDLVRVKARDGETPLHYVVARATEEDRDLVALFLTACPKSIDDLTIRLESAMHIAVKYRRLRVFEVLLGWLKRANRVSVLNWGDEDGNTVLHIATSTNQPEIVKLLFCKKIVKMISINATNSEGLTALDIFQLPTEIDKRVIGDMLCRVGAKRSSSSGAVSPADYLTSEMSGIERICQSLRFYRGEFSQGDIYNAVLVVAVLIATTTFQAGLSPPGGFWQDDYNPLTLNATASTSDKMLHRGKHYAGHVIMDVSAFVLFSFCNSAAFYSSIGVIQILTMGLRYGMLQTSLLFLGVTHSYSVFYTLPTPHHWSDGAALSLLIIAEVICLLLMAVIPPLSSPRFVRFQRNGILMLK